MKIFRYKKSNKRKYIFFITPNIGYFPPIPSDNPTPKPVPSGSPWYGHGNWCGKGWSGGEYPKPGETNWNVPAVDSIDECCKKHDACFQGYDLEKKRYCKKRKSKEECNKEFVQCINNLPPEDIVNHPFLYIFYPIIFSPPFSWWPIW